MLQSCVFITIIIIIIFSTLRFLQLTYYLHHTSFSHALLILEYIHHLKKTFLKVYYLLKRDI